jgi:lipopolysaccharide/colanic/teichoic acid biosynthesis glycosyltransferase
MSGGEQFFLFILNDLITNTERFLFVIGFPTLFIVSLLVSTQLFRFPKFDLPAQLFVTNLVSYGFCGLILSALRIPLFSRPVILTEFVLSTALLLIYFHFNFRFFPILFGILPDVDNTHLVSNRYVKFRSLKSVKSNVEPLNGIVTNLRNFTNEENARYLADLAQMGIPAFDARGLSESYSGRVALSDITSQDLENFLPPAFYQIGKRLIDVLLTLPLILFFLAVMIPIGLAIKIDSRGPIFYKQIRLGRFEKPFLMYKFRSMVDTIPTRTIATSPGDKRITRTGRFLRRFHIDELPQLINVIKGEMSLVGPRPELPELAVNYSETIPFYGFRYTVRPGITGWAQIRYGYATGMEQNTWKLEYDFYYIRAMSFWFDLNILLRTITTVVSRHQVL